MAIRPYPCTESTSAPRLPVSQSPLSPISPSPHLPVTPEPHPLPLRWAVS
ncbi:hypothetical protein [[Phormidium] sp. ETS-05]|nr:hypothetical protein [[Phormidium] sp. ETS-05]